MSSSFEQVQIMHLKREKDHYRKGNIIAGWYHFAIYCMQAKSNELLTWEEKQELYNSIRQTYKLGSLPRYRKGCDVFA